MPGPTNGEWFPHIELSLVGGGRLVLPDALAGHFGVVLIFCGSWCPYCNAQLAAFERASRTLAGLDTRVAALSVDDERATDALVATRHLRFPVGYGANAKEIADSTGADANADPVYLNSTGFVLAPDGTVLTAVHSTGAIGRLMPEDAAGFIRYVLSSFTKPQRKR